MAFACDYCGYKSNEVKSGGAIPPKGKRIAVRLENFPLDLNRDILKSQSAGLVIPELNFELGPGTLGGKFTTVEGLLQSAKDQLENTPFIHGDSADRSGKSRMDVFLEELQEVRSVPDSRVRPTNTNLTNRMSAFTVHRRKAPVHLDHRRPLGEQLRSKRVCSRRGPRHRRRGMNKRTPPPCCIVYQLFATNSSSRVSNRCRRLAHTHRSTSVPRSRTRLWACST